MKIALLENDSLCYGSLSYFTYQINNALQRKGIQTCIVSTITNEFLTEKWDAVIGINQEVFSAQLDDGTYIFDLLNCPLFLLIVDSPYVHDRVLKKHAENLYLICLDENHVEYAKTYYGPFKNVEMGYVLGAYEHTKDYCERQTEIFFSGTLPNLNQIYNKIQSYHTDWISELFEYLVEVGKTAPDFRTEDLVQLFFQKKGMNISKEDYKTAMAICGSEAEFYLRGYYREKIIMEISKSGIPLKIIGDGWNRISNHLNGNIQLINGVEFKDTLSYTSDAKICLNIMPWFKNGCHDRIPTSMHNASVCLTDRSKFLETHFTDGEEIVFFELRKIHELPQKISYLMEHPEAAAKIAESGRRKVMNSYTWENMVDNYILRYLK